MSIINSFDTSDEIVKPELFTNDLPKLPEIAIVCFKYELYAVFFSPSINFSYVYNIFSISFNGSELNLFISTFA